MIELSETTSEQGDSMDDQEMDSDLRIKEKKKPKLTNSQKNNLK